ncbi:MAG: hypothetical protein LBG87_03185 [Spirochaetaceae bacterium]|jgi:hypothetical protein|nr:hypothetical protein [Spirochaetaceae bacterium]
MDISINERPADIVLESEKTVGDVLAGIDGWLAGTKNRISGLRIDGLPVDASDLGEVFQRDLQGIRSIDITVSTWQDLALEALITMQDYLNIYETGSFEEQRCIRDGWEASVSAHFLAEQIPDIFGAVRKTLAREGLSPRDAARLVDERIKELIEPREELKHISPVISEIAVRLEDLPLDMQTGKDSRAAETIQLFSHIADKLLRLIRFSKLQGDIPDSLGVDNLPLNDFIDAFADILKELLSAYETQDPVLVGDLAEYELAPRLLKLYAALTDPKAA